MSATGFVFRATHARQGLALEAHSGSVVNLNLVTDSQTAHDLHRNLEAESHFRLSFLNHNQRVVRQGTGDWSFTSLRRVYSIQVTPPQTPPTRSVLQGLGLEKTLRLTLRHHSRRACPACGRPLLEQIPPETLQGLDHSAPGDLSITVSTTLSPGSCLEKGYEWALMRGVRHHLSSIPATVSAHEFMLIVDTLPAGESRLKRLTESVELARTLAPQQISLFSWNEQRAELLAVFNPDATCPDGHFAAESLLPPTLFSAALTEQQSQQLESFRLGEHSLRDILCSPSASCTVPGIERAGDIFSRHATALSDRSISLLTAISTLCPADQQIIRLIEHLIAGTTNSLLVVEEPVRCREQPQQDGARRILKELANQGNLILTRETETEGVFPVPAATPVSSLLQLLPHEGEKILHWSPHPSPLRKWAETVDGKTLSPAAAILLLPELSSMRNSTRNVAESLELVPALCRLYERLPLSQSLGLKVSQLMTLRTPGMTPLFKGIPLPEALTLTAAAALEHFGKVPDCARSLQPVSDLGLGHLRLDQPISELPLGELNLLRLTGINPRPAKLRRIYLMSFPLCGLNQGQQARAVRTFNDLTRAGHSIVFSDCDTRLGPLADRCLKFAS